MKTREYVTNGGFSEQYLLGKNQVYIFGPIDTCLAHRIIPQMHYIEQKMIDDNVPEEDREQVGS